MSSPSQSKLLSQKLLAQIAEIPSPCTVPDFAAVAAGMLHGNLGLERDFATWLIRSRLNAAGMPEMEVSDHLGMLVAVEYPVPDLIATLVKNGPLAVRDLLTDTGQPPQPPSIALPPTSRRITVNEQRIALIRTYIDDGAPFLQLTGQSHEGRHESRLSQMALVSLLRQHTPGWTDLEDKTLLPAVRATLYGCHGNVGRAR